MASTHALTLVGAPASHGLLSDFWLPNGWATSAYVVLSGYGIGWVLSVRYAPSLRSAMLWRRSAFILLVMVLSNSFFAIAKLAVEGDLATALTGGWWLGFVTLATPWSISSVLLPTALVLLCGQSMIRLSYTHPWRTLAGIGIGLGSMALLAILLATSPAATSWPVRFFLLEGLGGFPVLAFVLNGCFGIWLGVQRHRDEPLWLHCIALLLVLQLGIYASTFAPPSLLGSWFQSACGAVSKFAWLFLCANVLARARWQGLVAPIALIGKYALSTFVLHRLFLQALAMGIAGLGLAALPLELRYAVLWLGTLAMSWAVCMYRHKHPRSQPVRPHIHGPQRPIESYFIQ